MAFTKANTEKYLVAAAHPEVRRRLERRSELLDGGCIEWSGSRSGEGYGTLTIGKVKVYAHRLAYTVWVGAISPELVVDHICHNRACINTEHMALADMVSNSRRSVRSLVTACPHGHEYSEENTRTWVSPKGHVRRYCITCTNRRNAERGNTSRES